MEKGGMHRSVHAQLDRTSKSCATVMKSPEARKRAMRADSKSICGGGRAERRKDGTTERYSGVGQVPLTVDR